MFEKKRKLFDDMGSEAGGSITADLKAKYGPKPPPEPPPEAPTDGLGGGMGDPSATAPQIDLAALPPEVLEVLKALIAAKAGDGDETGAPPMAPKGV